MAETKLPNSFSLPFVETLFQDYLRDPESVPPDWRHYFQGLSDGMVFETQTLYLPSSLGVSLILLAVRAMALLPRKPRKRFFRNASIN